MATMNLDELRKRVEAKLIKAVANEAGKLTLYNYTPMCQYDAAWDEYTTAARGIVLDDHGNVIARPWPKFFNLGERPEAMLHALPAEVPELSTKHDGSLVIVFWDPYSGDDGRWTAITRGCWDNAQTRWANAWIARRSAIGAEVAVARASHGAVVAWGDACGFHRRFTYLFELVAPWNRIVLPYDTADMILLGVVETPSGRDLSYAETEVTASMLGVTSCAYERRPLDLSSLSLDDPRVRDREGYVARFSTGLRVKLKYSQYQYLHKLLTCLSIKGVWESLAAPAFARAGKWTGPIPEITLDADMPVDFVRWFERQRDALVADFEAMERSARAAFAGVSKPASRKEHAAEFQRFGNLTPIMFAMLDGKPYDHIIWKQVRPTGGGEETFQKDGEWS